MKKRNIFQIEYLLYLFLILSPFFDATSFLFRTIFPQYLLSPSTILRPIIPLILCLYIFIKDPKSRIHFILGGIIYTSYMIGHLYATDMVLTSISYKGLSGELQFVINYSYMIFLFYAIYWLLKNKKLPYLKQSLTLMLTSYLGLIYLSIVTGTSSPTYIEKIGYKGWNMSGNGLGAILVLTYTLLLPYLMEHKKKWWTWMILVSLIFFLLVLFGTRTGLYGVILVSAFYLVINITRKLLKRPNINWKLFSLILVVVLLIGSFLMVQIGSKTLKRRQHLENIESSIIDPLTGKPAHLTGDTTRIVVSIKENTYEEGSISETQKKAFLKLYDMANKYNIASHDQRSQQLLYHTAFYLEQKNPILYLFGNGYQSHHREMTFEMEVPALFYNFGIIGFLLYLGPFILLDIYGVIFFLKHIKKLSIGYVMSLCACLLAFILSFLTGYVYFYVPSMMIAVCSHILLLQEMDLVQNMKFEK